MAQYSKPFVTKSTDKNIRKTVKKINEIDKRYLGKKSVMTGKPRGQGNRPKSTGKLTGGWF